MDYIIATLGSHSCLQILKGAKDEGFKTLAICLDKNLSFYRRFAFIDEIIGIDQYTDFYKLEKKLKKQNVIVVPHGSFVAYLGKAGDKKISLPYFGNKKILEIEGDRIKQNNWLKKAKLTLPKIYKSSTDIHGYVIIKYHGAKGGNGYFVTCDKKDLEKKLNKYNINKNNFIIQEYIVGVPVYLQYFYSIISKRMELMGIDRRYETDVDGIGRIPANLQLKQENVPTYTVIGNFPIVIRESLLPEIYSLGERVVEASRKLAPPKGLYGAFCLETIVTPDQQFYCIEISCRIVAGTNLYISGSPYSDLINGIPMSTGRRIAREIKEAIQLKKEDEIFD